jgi:hypothetical protein
MCGLRGRLCWYGYLVSKLQPWSRGGSVVAFRLAMSFLSLGNISWMRCRSERGTELAVADFCLVHPPGEQPAADIRAEKTLLCFFVGVLDVMRVKLRHEDRFYDGIGAEL